jgi:non-ribosomal peptide synthase protein (TIGR01720 family)
VAGAAAVDLSRTVGWFTSISPLRLELKTLDTEKALKSVKEQVRRRPDHGFGYGVLRYLSEKQKFRSLPEPEVSFNYLGQFDALLDQAAMFRLAGEQPGPTFAPRSRRRHLIDINSMVIGGQLRVEWTYCSHVHSRSTIEALAAAFLAELRSILALCLNPLSGGFTPSDFPLAALSDNKLDRIAALLAKADGAGSKQKRRQAA